MLDQVPQPLFDNGSWYAQRRHVPLHEQAHRPCAWRIRETAYVFAGLPWDEIVDGAAGAVGPCCAVDDGLPEPRDRVEVLTAD